MNNGKFKILSKSAFGIFYEAENLFDTFVRTDESHSLVWLEENSTGHLQVEEKNVSLLILLLRLPHMNS